MQFVSQDYSTAYLHIYQVFFSFLSSPIAHAQKNLIGCVHPFRILMDLIPETPGKPPPRGAGCCFFGAHRKVRPYSGKRQN